MDKLGYTFYPKDWWTSSTFFKLPPELRYLYLEIISMMYMNDGQWEANRYELHKRFGVDPGDKGWELLQSMFTVDGKFWTHTSVNKRLRKAIANRQNGQLGGRPKTQKTQPRNPKKPTLEREREEERESELEILNSWVEWGNLIVANQDQYWEQMRVRKVTKDEMDKFISIAIRKKWRINTAQEFRYSLKGFDPNEFKQGNGQQKNRGNLQ